jgi:hypothetical protein
MVERVKFGHSLPIVERKVLCATRVSCGRDTEIP